MCQNLAVSVFYLAQGFVIIKRAFLSAGEYRQALRHFAVQKIVLKGNAG
jgi:hypothetical protein